MISEKQSRLPSEEDLRTTSTTATI